MSKAQFSLLEEKIVDSFAGGGGASTGIELATGRVVDIAINHDPDAILMHKTNHPHTMHYQASVWDVDPMEVTGGSPVGLFWASPDCKHFSKAKGGKPVDKQIRGLAWIVLRWAGTVRPRVIILENVEEFQTWGPVRKGRPVKAKAGQTFRRFISQLEDLGYSVEWRELVAADYGAPTTRKRFFLIARCDGRPIVWPEPTHAPVDRPEVKAGLKKPWRSAAEIIDWTLPCPSIFDTREEIKAKYGLNAQRPLRPNTMRRVARGVDKFVIKSAVPYILPMGCGPRDPNVVPWTVTNTTNSTGHPVNEPIDTARTGGGDGQMFMSASLIQYHTERSEMVRGQGITNPLMTVDASNRYGLAAATLTKYYSGADQAQDVGQPLHTVTTKDREGVTVASLSKYYGGIVGADLRNWPKIRDLLNTYCGYHLAENEVILFLIGGAWYIMADIGLRMLTPRELYRANGFPDDYKIDRDYLGHVYGKGKQVARCGNAVPPPFATALVRANFPEWCGKNLTTMEELEKEVAV